MKPLLMIALAAAVVYFVAKDLVERADRVPTLKPVRDAEPLRPEPLQEDDLNIAQNAPL